METVKLIHISAVLLSILFFAGRGVVMFHDASFTGKKWVRRIAESIDTVLLLSGIALAWLTEQLPWQDAWLGAKLMLLLLYILLGMVAFHWSRSRMVKMAAWVAAIVTYAGMVFIALSRNPWPFTT
ncbi:MAG: SirB2 family protein [Mariprofundaceae bacterium]|nr:SirB2 family protein [Mariprofundaceae bacterium]